MWTARPVSRCPTIPTGGHGCNIDKGRNLLIKALWVSSTASVGRIIIGMATGMAGVLVWHTTGKHNVSVPHGISAKYSVVSPMTAVIPTAAEGFH